MKIKKSQLELIDFIIINTKYQFYQKKNDNRLNSIRDIFKEYEIDLDFNFKTNPDRKLLVFIKTSINQLKYPLPGYILFVEGLAIFNMPDKKTLNEEDFKNLVYYSSLSIAINNIRNYISNLTIYYPLGKFVLPAIDLNDLHEKKRKLMEGKNKR